MTEQSTPVTPSSPVESAIQAASKTKQDARPLPKKSVGDSKKNVKAAKPSVKSAPAPRSDQKPKTDRKPMLEQKPQVKKKPTPKPSLPEAPARPKRSFEEEIAARKKNRKRAKVAAIAAVCVMTAGLAAAGIWYGINEFKTYEGNMSELDQALSLIQDADETVLRIDELTADPFSGISVSSTGAVDQEGELVRLSTEGDSTSKFQIGAKELTLDASELMDVRSQIQTAFEMLDRADQKARIASEGLRAPEDKEAANQAIIGVDARRKMLTAATALTDPVQAAAECVEVANVAWEKVVLADDLARQSSDLLGQGSVEEAQASKAKSEEAKAVLQGAYSLFESAAALYPGVDFGTYYTYLDKRIAAMDCAIASDDALVARNKEEATAQNDAYIAADAEAVELAKQLPANPEEVVRQAYDAAVAPAVQEYETARLQAGTADAALRDYLGIQGK